MGTSFGSNKESSDVPEANNQWTNSHVFSLPIHFFQYLYSACARAKTCLPCLNYIWIMFHIKVALDMAATLGPPYFQVSLEKVHKTDKQRQFWENTWPEET